MKKNCLFFLLILLVSLQTFAQSFETHKVKSGENISSIAKKYNVSEQSIYKYNPDAKKGNLTGVVLVIPVSSSSDNRNYEKQSVLNFKEYKVKRKETLYSIAKANGISVGDLKKYNTYLYDEELGKGDVIRIPVFSKNDTININNSVQNSSFENLKHIVMPQEGKMAIARTIIPIPPIQCVVLRQNKTPSGIASISFKIDAPVVVYPLMVSKKALVNEGIAPVNK